MYAKSSVNATWSGILPMSVAVVTIADVDESRTLTTFSLPLVTKPQRPPGANCTLLRPGFASMVLVTFSDSASKTAIVPALPSIAYMALPSEEKATPTTLLPALTSATFFNDSTSMTDSVPSRPLVTKARFASGPNAIWCEPRPTAMVAVTSSDFVSMTLTDFSVATQSWSPCMVRRDGLNAVSTFCSTLQDSVSITATRL